MAFGITWGRLLPLVRKEFRQNLRDPRAARIIFLSPIVQLLLFGYAVNTDVRNARTFVLDRDHTEESRELLAALTASGYFTITGYGSRPQDLVETMDRGSALMAVEIPRGFSADLAAGRQAHVQVLFDGTSSNTATVALGYATQIIQRFAFAQAQARLAAAGAGGGAGPQAGAAVDLRARAWYNPNLISRVYNVPGVMGTIMMLMALLLTSLAVVREREIGTLEQLMVSPLSPAELMLGKTIPVAVIAFIQLTVISTIAVLWFHIPIRGSVPLLLVGSLFYILSGLGMGLLISTVAATQQEAFMTMFFLFFPAIILSGFMYPVENMPVAFQYLSLLNPIRHYLVIVRGVFLKAAGWGVLWPQLTILFVMGTSVVFVATKRFHKTTA